MYSFIRPYLEINQQWTQFLLNQTIETFIASCSPERQERLRQFQWRLDQELNRYKDPVARYNRMIELFWDGVTIFHQSLENPSLLKKDGITDNVVKFKQPS